MSATSTRLEKRYLMMSVAASASVGCVGLLVAMLSSSQAILLDGLFNLVYFTTALFTVKIVSLVMVGDDERFPYGYAYFEPLVNCIKGMLMLGVSMMALVGAVQTLLVGGRTVAAGIAIAYGVFACLICGTTAYLTRRGFKMTGSPMVQADADNWLVNLAYSACVLIAFVGILALRALKLDAMIPFVDPIVVLAVVTVSLGVPVRMSWTALMELLNRAPDRSVVDEVTEFVDANLKDFPVQERFVRVVQPGRQRIVLVHIVLPSGYNRDSLEHLDAIRSQTYEALSRAHADTIVDILFTADRQWAAPISEGGAGGPRPL